MSFSFFSRIASQTRNPVPPMNGLRFSSTTKAAGPRLWAARPWIVFSAVTTLSIGTYTFGVVYPPTLLSILFPRSAPGPPADPTSPESIALMDALEVKLQNLPQLQKLRDSPDADDWYETRPYRKYPEERRVNSLTAGTLSGPGKLACNPLVRARKDETESMVFIHVGRALCGHDGIIHGGLLATLLDESLSRTVCYTVSGSLLLSEAVTQPTFRQLSTYRIKSVLQPIYRSIIVHLPARIRFVYFTTLYVWLEFMFLSLL